MAFGFTLYKMPTSELTYVRQLFHSPTSEAKVKELLGLTEEKYMSNEIMAYKAVATTMMAEYVGNPFDKYGYFSKGKKQLEAIIAKDKNIETVYLRLLVQLNSPSFLGYSSNIESDLHFFCTNFEDSNIEPEVKNLFKETLINTKKVEDYAPQLKQLKEL